MSETESGYVEIGNRAPAGNLIHELFCAVVIHKDGTEGIFAFGDTVDSVKPLVFYESNRIRDAKDLIAEFKEDLGKSEDKLELRKFQLVGKV